MQENETVHTLLFKADSKKAREEMKLLNLESLNLGKSIVSSFENIIFKGKDVETVFKSLALQLSKKAFNSALKPVEQLFSSGIDSGANSLFGSIFGFAKGGAFASGGGGGILSSPAAFPLSGGNIGVAGEAGPEAILPLTRSANGELGVRSSGAAPINIQVTINATDIESFRRSEGEIAATLQRITSRGNRNL